MVQAIKEWVTIKAGGLIELRRPQLPEGALAEVIVILENDAPLATLGSEESKLSDFFGVCRGMFRSKEEVDEYIRELREEWDR